MVVKFATACSSAEKSVSNGKGGKINWDDVLTSFLYYLDYKHLTSLLKLSSSAILQQFSALFGFPAAQKSRSPCRNWGNSDL